MNQHFTETTLKATGASALVESEVIQSLWSGYGKIVRVGLEYGVGTAVPAVLPSNGSAPDGAVGTPRPTNVAWTDFFRFLQGWSPGHWKIHRYSERLARKVLDQLNRLKRM